MFDKLGYFIIKSRWVIIAGWILLAVLVTLKAPVLSDVAKSDQQSFLPADSQVTKASKLIKELYPEKGSGSSLIITLDRSGAMDDKDAEYAVELEQFFIQNKEKFNIREIRSPFSRKELENVMISKTKDAAIMQLELTVPGFHDTTREVVKGVRASINSPGAKYTLRAPQLPAGLTVHVTGDAALGQETMDNVHQSMDMTLKITLVLVLTVLFLIYRAVLAPFIPLLTIGISFMVSKGVVAALTGLGLKVSSFTETFMIAVLFGAGTDYCLLLVSRYREEIVSGKSSLDAFRTAIPSSFIAIITSGGSWFSCHDGG